MAIISTARAAANGIDQIRLAGDVIGHQSAYTIVDLQQRHQMTARRPRVVHADLCAGGQVAQLIIVSIAVSGTKIAQQSRHPLSAVESERHRIGTGNTAVILDFKLDWRLGQRHAQPMLAIVLIARFDTNGVGPRRRNRQADLSATVAIRIEIGPLRSIGIVNAPE